MDRPGHDQRRFAGTTGHGHISLDDAGLLDVGSRRSHGHVVSPDDVFLADPRDPAGIAADVDRRVEGEERVVDRPGGPAPRNK